MRRHAIQSVAASRAAVTDVDEFALPPAASSAALVERLREVPIPHGPGTTHEYLNANHVAAARIIETPAGRSASTRARRCCCRWG